MQYVNCEQKHCKNAQNCKRNLIKSMVSPVSKNMKRLSLLDTHWIDLARNIKGGV